MTKAVESDYLAAADPEATARPGLNGERCVPGVPVTLADGQVWRFAYAHIRIRSRELPDGKVDCEYYVGWHLRAQRAMDELRSAAESSDSVPIPLILGAAAALLMEAHDLDRPTALALLEGGVHDLIRYEAAIVAAARGQAAGDGDGTAEGQGGGS